MLSGADSSGNVFNLKSSGTGFFVKPVREGNGAANLRYDPTTGEITYDQDLRRRRLMSRTEATVGTVQAAEAAAVWDLRPVTFRALNAEAKVDGDTSYGFVAEEVAEIDPRLVFWTEGTEGQRRAEGIDYEQVVALLLRQTKAFKEAHEAQIKAHEVQIKALEEKVEALLAHR